MIFTEPRYLVFLIVAFCVYWASPWNVVRKVWLLACSYVFYAAWDYRFLSLILISTAVDYVVGIGLGRVRRPAGRRALLVTSLVVNLGLLGVFKYFDFFAGSAEALAERLGFHLSAVTLDVVLPVGISFYTFQTLSYSIDVYRGKLGRTKNPLDFALFVAFFPQLVAGPIVRAMDFLPQLTSKRRFSSVKFRACATLFLVGFVKKACISDNIAEYVDLYFANPGAYDALSGVTAVLAYAAQIYCDFSGYSDMAIASAGLLGFRMPLNFNAPYVARSVTEFWRRWHISLSTWLRDYLYIPLGGSRGGKLFTYRNLMLTMLLGGLWHGAAWTFVVWGAMHGGALVIQKEWQRRVPGAESPGPIRMLIAWAVTFYFVCICWIFFRAPDFGSAAEITRVWTTFESSGTKSLPRGLLAVLGIGAGVHIVWESEWFGSVSRRVPTLLADAALGACAALALAFVRADAQPFIYFQF